MKRSRFLKVWLATSIILLGAISQTACGEKTKITLDRVGRVATNIAKGVNDQIAALKAGGVDPIKIRQWERLGAALDTSTKALKDRLDKLKEVNPRDISEVAQEVGASLSLVNALLTNPDIGNLGDTSLFVKTLRYASIGFNQLSLTLAGFLPPPGVSIASSTKVWRMDKIEIEFATPPPELRAILTQ